MNLFGTAGIRGDVVEDVDPELALDVGRAVGRLADDRGDVDVTLAADGRVSGPGLVAATEAGVLSAGSSVRRTGVLPTPALAFASQGGIGVAITASHNPPSDNGIKLFSDGAEVDASTEQFIEEEVAGDPGPAEWQRWGSAETVDVLGEYLETVVEYACQWGSPLAGLSVAVDCANGTGALATPQVLRTLDAEVTALNANVDGAFPARGSKPTPESLRGVGRFVADGDFDVGFAHDGDADRLVVIDSDGAVVHEDTIVAVLAERYVATAETDAPVVITTPNASARIDERVEAAGGRTVRVGLGTLHEGLADTRADGAVVAFAAEPWKHVHPGLGPWIDGIASAAILARLIAGAGGIGPLVEPVAERPYRKESIPCPDRRKDDAMERLRSTLPARFESGVVSTEHGVRIELPAGGWLLVRPSGTEPYVRLYAESDDVDEFAAEAREAVEEAVDEAGGDR